MTEFHDSLDVTVIVNGTTITRSILCRMTLAQFLRDELGLTGTKVSCELQVCGACTVLVDGQPVSSCTYLAIDADGRRVRTVEGLRVDGELSPLQSAFIDNSALQCGFCTAGFLMTASALLEEDPDPSRDAIMEHLEGNICRCTGYEPIVEAVVDASRRLRSEATA